MPYKPQEYNLPASLKVARVSTVSFFVVSQLKRQIEDIIDMGVRVTIIASEDSLGADIRGATYQSIKIVREISVVSDLIAVCKLFRSFYKNQFDIVHSTTPKAGLVAAIAAYFARVPVRIHTYTGQVWVEKKGAVRVFSIWADRLIGLLSTCCYADSPSQVAFLIKNRIVSEKKIGCLGFGSLAGVDLKRFNGDNYSVSDRFDMRAKLNVPVDNKVLTFIGRCTKDKGVAELLKAFEKVVEMGYKLTLLIVGPVEDGVLEELTNLNESAKKMIRLVGRTSDPEHYLAITDIFLLPSYREGFGTVVIEAAAMGVPTIGTRIYGLQDAIIDNETGCLVTPKNVPELAEAISRLLADDAKRMDMGVSAACRARECFSSAYVSALLFSEYQRLSLKPGTRS